jgi:cysteine desulfurase/selenocysteine lyase
VFYAIEELKKLDFIDLYLTPNLNNHSSVISFNIKGVHPHDVASILDSEGVCVRSRKPLCTATFKIYGNRFNMQS